MADDLSADAEPVRRIRAQLDYPSGGPPAPGEASEVAPGVLWLRMPLPMSLDHINLWALRDGDGWTIVDTGLHYPRTIEAWEAVLAGPLEGRPVKRIICTHMHPDHAGCAGWLRARFGCDLWMTRLEYVVCRMLIADTGRPAPEDGVGFYRAAGWTEAQIDTYRARFGGFGAAFYPMPDSYRRIRDEEIIDVDGRGWRVIVGTGHSPEHACLYCADLNVLISGDQILPRISSNISVWPTEPEGDPLDDWMSSIDKFHLGLSGGVLILPSHGDPFLGVHERLDELKRRHEMSLTRLERALQEPKRAVDTFGNLFARKVDDDVLSMATGEAIAHLHYLRGKGRAVSEIDEHGVRWWRAVT